jgi:hypothetical protein
MIQRNFVPLALATLAIAACQKPADDSNIAIDNGTNAAANTAVATPAPGQTSSAAAQIPAAFRGRWGINLADCTSDRGDAKGLLTIAETGLTFYEARGTLAKIITASATQFDARYAFAGEGQTWKRTERLTLTGDRLQRRTDREPGQEPPVNLRYIRCGG